jgi:hypothetical protein
MRPGGPSVLSNQWNGNSAAMQGAGVGRANRSKTAKIQRSFGREWASLARMLLHW